MVLTLGVSKFSGWLNANANCQAEGRYATWGEVWAGKREGVGRRFDGRKRHAYAACGMRRHAACGMRGRDVGAQRGRAERTTNIPCMVVTLDVLKLSGWLNTDACTAEQKGKHAMFGARCGPGGGRA